MIPPVVPAVFEQRYAFALRFENSAWQLLCADDRFCAAFLASDWPLANRIALGLMCSACIISLPPFPANPVPSL